MKNLTCLPIRSQAGWLNTSRSAKAACKLAQIGLVEAGIVRGTELSDFGRQALERLLCTPQVMICQEELVTAQLILERPPSLRPAEGQEHALSARSAVEVWRSVACIGVKRVTADQGDVTFLRRGQSLLGANRQQLPEKLGDRDSLCEELFFEVRAKAVQHCLDAMKSHLQLKVQKNRLRRAPFYRVDEDALKDLGVIALK